MIPDLASNFVLFYAAFSVIVLLLFLRRQPSSKILLRFRGDREKRNDPPELNGYSHIAPESERPLNCVFNYNGHSWDAYEVLGLPAGSKPEAVELAYTESMKRVEPSSRPFVDAAYHAILAQWSTFKKAERA